MRNWKTTYALAALGIGSTLGCQTRQAADEEVTTETTMTEEVTVDESAGAMADEAAVTQPPTQTAERTTFDGRTAVEGPNDAELPVGCAPANRDPAESWRSMGRPNYVKPGCEVTAATAGAGAAADEIAATDETTEPLAEVPAEPETQNQDIVEGEGGTPCGLTVIALSSAAVGDPCMTTEGVIEGLTLTDEQRDAALAGISDARSLTPEETIAH